MRLLELRDFMRLELLLPPPTPTPPLLLLLWLRVIVFDVVVVLAAAAAAVAAALAVMAVVVSNCCSCCCIGDVASWRDWRYCRYRSLALAVPLRPLLLSMAVTALTDAALFRLLLLPLLLLPPLLWLLPFLPTKLLLPPPAPPLTPVLPTVSAGCCGCCCCCCCCWRRQRQSVVRALGRLRSVHHLGRDFRPTSAIVCGSSGMACLNLQPLAEWMKAHEPWKSQ